MTVVRSMTAFARHQEQGNWGVANWEIRSVNHRYLEINLNLPEVWRDLEGEIRELIKKYVKRGKLDVSLHYKPGEAVSLNVEVNQTFAHQLLNACNVMTQEISHPAKVNIVDILKWPGVTEITEDDPEFENSILIKLLDAALHALVEMRESEGAKLLEFVTSRLDSLVTELDKIKQRLPSVIERQQQRLTEKLAKFKEELDPSRVEQEMLLFINKVDVAEEVDRFEAHITAVRTALSQGGSMGRRLDFLMQELNREANTIASKSLDPAMTSMAVECKVLVEQMREQVQNIE